MYQYEAIVTRVIDGDTIDTRVDLGFDISLDVRFRLYGINSPEKTGSTKEAGLKSKEFLRELIEGKLVRIESLGKEKYGRYLANVMLGEQCVNQSMIDAGLAVQYFGGKR